MGIATGIADILYLTCIVPINSISYGFRKNVGFPAATLDLWLAVGALLLYHIVRKTYLENVTKAFMFARRV
jgi:hypothetical protein